jgi:GTPase SAR1 family protein
MSWISQAKATLKQTLQGYEQQLSSQPNLPSLQASVTAAKAQLEDAIAKLDENLLRVAVFGMVSRGKSAVINGLIGRKLLPTGPLHGVTKYPRSVYWSPELLPELPGNELTVELIDTPGLDEVGGEERGAIAQDIVDRADLILFVVAGEVTRTEVEALQWLRETHKPLVLVGNKADRFPEETAQSLQQKFQAIDAAFLALSPQDVVFVAAEPAPIQVRVEYADGRVTNEWESPPPQMDQIKSRLLPLLKQEGAKLLALNALRQSRTTEQAIAHETIHLQAERAQAMVDQFTRWKAVAIAANPIPLLDLAGGFLADLVLIRSLARLYQLPMTNHNASQLLNTLLVSSGGLLLGELGTNLLTGGTDALSGSGGFLGYVAGAIAQAALAGYGTQRVSKAAKDYLEAGCTWTPQGSDTVMQAMLSTPATSATPAKPATTQAQPDQSANPSEPTASITDSPSPGQTGTDASAPTAMLGDRPVAPTPAESSET